MCGPSCKCLDCKNYEGYVNPDDDADLPNLGSEMIKIKILN